MKKHSLYVYSFNTFCGKSLICLGLALKFKEKGYKVGYFKPIGFQMANRVDGKKIDEDAKLMIEILGLNLSIEEVAPIIIGNRFLEETYKIDQMNFKKIVKEAYEKVSREMDIMILEGPSSLGIGTIMGMDPITISNEFNSLFLLVSSIDNDFSADRIIWEKKCSESIGINLLGTILNLIPRNSIERVNDFVVSILNRNNIEVLGIIPENRSLKTPTAREICEQISCKILVCEDELDKPVERILVGAMMPDLALTYFRRAPRKIVVTGGDRPDVQLAALQTNTSALILTGNIYPDVRVLSKAEELKVPVILVPYDTFITINKISALLGRIKSTENEKIKKAKELVEEYVDWEKILNKL